MMVATDMAGGELTQADLEASMNAAHAHLREGTPESADQARDLLEEILEARCDGAQASSMVRLQCEAKYELAGILQDAGHDVEARALYLEAIDGFVQHDCLQAALNAKMGYGLLLCDADDMEAAIPLLEEAYWAGLLTQGVPGVPPRGPVAPRRGPLGSSPDKGSAVTALPALPTR
jgi:hypothetical protein